MPDSANSVRKSAKTKRRFVYLGALTLVGVTGAFAFAYMQTLWHLRASQRERRADCIGATEQELSMCWSLPGLVASIMQSLSPLTIDGLKDDIGACCHTVGSRASDRGFLPMSVANYLELLDWTARELRASRK